MSGVSVCSEKKQLVKNSFIPTISIKSAFSRSSIIDSSEYRQIGPAWKDNAIIAAAELMALSAAALSIFGIR